MAQLEIQGLPMDRLPGASTAVLLWLLAKLAWVQQKFGMGGQGHVRHQKTE